MALPVEIVRPKKSKAELVGAVIGTLANLAISGWIVMLLAPSIELNLGYWQSVALCLFARNVIGQRSDYGFWTRAER